MFRREDDAGSAVNRVDFLGLRNGLFNDEVGKIDKVRTVAASSWRSSSPGRTASLPITRTESRACWTRCGMRPLATSSPMASLIFGFVVPIKGKAFELPVAEVPPRRVAKNQPTLIKIGQYAVRHVRASCGSCTRPRSYRRAIDEDHLPTTMLTLTNSI